MSSSPPRIFGTLLLLYGIALAAGGTRISGLGGDGRFPLVIGAGIAVSGLLIAMGWLLGAYLFAGTIIVSVVWSIAEVGFDPTRLITRLAFPVILMAYVFFSVKPRLS